MSHRHMVLVLDDLCGELGTDRRTRLAKEAFEAARALEAERLSLAARLETALGLLREVMPAGSHQHVGDCWFCRVRTILATVDADTAREGT